jgi:sulfide:quinone oxidoreductase
VRELVVEYKIAILSDGTEMPYDLFMGIPVHRAPAVAQDSGLAVDGWIPVNPLTLETEFPGVYAIGDVTSVGTAKAGVFAEGQAAVVAQQIGALQRGEDYAASYDGRGSCYIEFGHDQVGRVDVTFLSGQRPMSTLEGPSPELAADKASFGSRRVLRWFDRTWP